MCSKKFQSDLDPEMWICNSSNALYSLTTDVKIMDLKKYFEFGPENLAITVYSDREIHWEII